MATEGSGMSKHDKYIFAVFCSILVVIAALFEKLIVAFAILALQWFFIWLGQSDEKPKIAEYKPLDLNGNGTHD